MSSGGEETTTAAAAVAEGPSFAHHDPATASNYELFHVHHMDLRIDAVDFTTSELRSEVTLRVRHLEPTEPALPGAERSGSRLDAMGSLNLDVHKLRVQSVSCGTAEADAEMESVEFLVQEFTEFGSRLVIPLPQSCGKEALGVYTETEADGAAPGNGAEFLVRVRYVASDGPGLCWLTPQQTEGKTHPYLFTQGQAILNRSFFPCQDTQSRRLTFTAVVNAPAPLTVVVCGTRLCDNDGVPVEGQPDMRQFRFEMKHSIPPYLVAMAVGRIGSARIGPRSTVWAETVLLEAAQYEFDEITEQYLATGERLFGEYRWDICDIVVMPPSFGYGGMENPSAIFVTPCLLCGDRSLGDVIAHEISHSWFGNLVTPASSFLLFLSEGFTMWAQRQITKEVHGAAFTALEATTGWSLLLAEINHLGHDHPMTQLKVPADHGVDPEDTYNDVPYEKGFACVSYLRSLVESDEVFNNWLKQYCDDFAFQSVVAEQVIHHFNNYFPHTDTPEFHAEMDHWLHSPGTPRFTPDFSAAEELKRPADALVARWTDPATDINTFAAADVEGWPTYQTLYFLDCCVEKPVDAFVHGLESVEKMGELYGFPHSPNAEIQLRWSLLVAKHDVQSSFWSVRKFLTRQGKQKYNLPIYRALAQGSPSTKKLAKQAFSEAAPSYQDMVRTYVDRILKEHKLDEIEEDEGEAAEAESKGPSA